MLDNYIPHTGPKYPFFNFSLATVNVCVCPKFICWSPSCRRLLRVPWIARRSNQSTLKEIDPVYSLEQVMLKLKLQYFGHLMWRTDSLENTLMLGKIEGTRRGQQRMRWLDAITDSMGNEFEKTLGDSEGQGRLTCCSPWGHKELDMTDWTTRKLNKNWL